MHRSLNNNNRYNIWNMNYFDNSIDTNNTIIMTIVMSRAVPQQQDHHPCEPAGQKERWTQRFMTNPPAVREGKQLQATIQHLDQIYNNLRAPVSFRPHLSPKSQPWFFSPYAFGENLMLSFFWGCLKWISGCGTQNNRWRSRQPLSFNRWNLLTQEKA